MPSNCQYYSSTFQADVAWGIHNSYTNTLRYYRYVAYNIMELAVSDVMVAVTTASTHGAYPRTGGQAELACVAD